MKFEEKLRMMIHESVQETMDREIRRCLGVEEYGKPQDILNDLEKAICKMTDILICNEETKKEIVKDGELPSTIKIFIENRLEYGKIYQILDEDLKMAYIRRMLKKEREVIECRL